jgi:hypothetical protein
VGHGNDRRRRHTQASADKIRTATPLRLGIFDDQPKKIAAGAGLGLATVSPALFGKDRAKLNIGVSAYSYHNLSFDEMVAQLTALQIKEIEMSRGEFMLMNHPGEELFHLARLSWRRLGFAGFRTTLPLSSRTMIWSGPWASHRFSA